MTGSETPPDVVVTQPATDDLYGPPPPEFDEIAYLEAYPDIAKAVRSGGWSSGLHHYRVYGARENRLSDKRYLRAASGCTANFPPGSVDRVLISLEGECLISGWVSDSANLPLVRIALRQNGQFVGLTTQIARQSRDDADKKTGTVEASALAGFWALLETVSAIDVKAEVDVLVTAGDQRNVFALRPVVVERETFRDIALRVIAEARYPGDYETETFQQLDTGLGNDLIRMNARIARSITSGSCQLRFGIRAQHYAGSVVVVLSGNKDALMLQTALFSTCADFDQYEYIYVSNDPGGHELLLRDATIASRVYGVAITIILLPGDAGFGAAANAGAAAAESSRILFLSPAVLPRDNHWPRLHATAVASLPPAQTALFGVPLYYGDGSLMHAGVHIESQEAFSVREGRLLRREILNVEQYGGPGGVTGGQPVPAVSGAFLSVDRAWFETIGAFSCEFFFGGYDDTDLCLRSREAGTPAWLLDIPFWYLDQQPRTENDPAHDAAIMVNRWHFTRKWSELVKSGHNGARSLPLEE